jgi:DNA topoisomerase-1
MEYDFTAEMEENLDSVARGEKDWTKVVGTFYTPLAKTIAQVTDTADRVQIPVEKTGESCPTCGATEGGEVVIRSGKYGKFKSCSRYPDCNYTDRIIEKVPDVLCPLCQEGDVIIKASRWGKSFFGCSRYPQCDWASWLRPKPGDRVTIEAWQQLQAERAAKKAAKLEKQAGAGPTTPSKKKPAKPKKKASSRPKK